MSEAIDLLRRCTSFGVITPNLLADILEESVEDAIESKWKLWDFNPVNETIVSINSGSPYGFERIHILNPNHNFYKDEDLNEAPESVGYHCVQGEIAGANTSVCRPGLVLTAYKFFSIYISDLNYAHNKFWDPEYVLKLSFDLASLYVPLTVNGSLTCVSATVNSVNSGTLSCSDAATFRKGVKVLGGLRVCRDFDISGSLNSYYLGFRYLSEQSAYNRLSIQVYRFDNDIDDDTNEPYGEAPASFNIVTPTFSVSNDALVTRNLQVGGTINGVSFPGGVGELVEQELASAGDKTIGGNLTVGGTINGMSFPLNVHDQIINYLADHTGKLIGGNLTVLGTINGVSIPGGVGELVEQELASAGDKTIGGNLTVSGTINGVTFPQSLDVPDELTLRKINSPLNSDGSSVSNLTITDAGRWTLLDSDGFFLLDDYSRIGLNFFGITMRLAPVGSNFDTVLIHPTNIEHYTPGLTFPYPEVNFAVYFDPTLKCYISGVKLHNGDITCNTINGQSVSSFGVPADLSCFTLTTSGAATVGGTFSASGKATFGGGVDVSSGGLSVSGGLKVNTITSDSSLIAVTKPVQFQKATAVTAGGLSVVGGLVTDTLSAGNIYNKAEVDSLVLGAKSESSSLADDVSELAATHLLAGFNFITAPAGKYTTAGDFYNGFFSNYSSYLPSYSVLFSRYLLAARYMQFSFTMNATESDGTGYQDVNDFLDANGPLGHGAKDGFFAHMRFVRYSSDVADRSCYSWGELRVPFSFIQLSSTSRRFYLLFDIWSQRNPADSLPVLFTDSHAFQAFGPSNRNSSNLIAPKLTIYDPMVTVGKVVQPYSPPSVPTWSFPEYT